VDIILFVNIEVDMLQIAMHLITIAPKKMKTLKMTTSSEIFLTGRCTRIIIDQSEFLENRRGR
jgi:hypothetical protein